MNRIIFFILIEFFFIFCLVAQNNKGIKLIDNVFTNKLLSNVLNVNDEVAYFGLYWNDLTKTYLEQSNFENRLLQKTSANIHIKDPEILISEYKRLSRKLSEEIAEETEINKERIDRDIRYLGESLAKLAADNKITTNNSTVDFFLKELVISSAQEKQKQKYEAKMRDIEIKAEADLRMNLSNKLEPIKESIIKENKDSKDQFFRAFAYEKDESKEDYYYECYKFHDCFIKEVNKNYNVYNSDWLYPKCAKPVLSFQTTYTNGNYLSIAKRKKGLYDKFGNKELLDATNLFLDAALSEKNDDAHAYLFKSELEENIIKKMFYVLLADKFDHDDPEVEMSKVEVEDVFLNEFFKSIEQGDVSFIRESVENNFHLGLEKNGKTPIIVSIENDQDKILDLLIDNHPNKETILKNGHLLLFHMAAVDAVKCTKLMHSKGLDLGFVDSSNNGITALNIALDNGNYNVASYLLANIKSPDKALKYVKKVEPDQLKEACLFIYDKSDKYLNIIEKYDKAFLKDNYSRINITALPDDAFIYINGTCYGQGNCLSAYLRLDKSYLVEIQKKGFKTVNKNILLKKGQLANVRVVLKENPKTLISLKSHNDVGYQLKDWHDFYVGPSGLKKENKRNNEFNEELKQVARDKAKAEADAHNKRIKLELDKINSSIRMQNEEIKLSNEQLNKERLFEVSYASAKSIADTKNSNPKVNKEIVYEKINQLSNNALQESNVEEEKETETLKEDVIVAKEQESIMALDNNRNEENKILAIVQPKIMKDGINVIDIVGYDGAQLRVDSIVFVNPEKEGNRSINYQITENAIEFFPVYGEGSYQFTTTINEKDTIQIIEVKAEDIPKEYIGFVIAENGGFLEMEIISNREIIAGSHVTIKQIKSDQLEVVASGNIISGKGKRYHIELSRKFFEPSYGTLVMCDIE
ncbi:ankyrin repeat domain-containing protein [Carboxylicivirga caseinilyticus]|uniref:ankyrin repeat domain-containing protein n=1 Tax=Carboxylicivirga caseinilyticus TaxID=3417572 RepID=UPI003D352E63|nr:ankyrin repeat domain-containing protein [Marinilabiliaceae bacterium A049]